MALQPRQSQTIQLPFERLLKNNDLGIIENPLQRIDEDDLDKEIRTFHDAEGLNEVVDVNVLIRGAHLARDEEAFLGEGDLSAVEEKALRNEKVSKIWQESKELRVILLTCFVASIVQGWAQGAIVGANQSWPTELGLTTGLTGSTKGHGSIGDIWRFSGTNAIVYFSASTLGAFLCDPLTELVTGRRGALFVAATFTFAASVGAAYTHSWQALFTTRVLLGIGMGAKTSIVPVYESEVSPARLRGTVFSALHCGHTNPDRPISCLMADGNRPRNSLFGHSSSHCTAKLALPSFELVHTFSSASLSGIRRVRIPTLADQKAALRGSLQGSRTTSRK